jgi:voltage-gated sodium channel
MTLPWISEGVPVELVRVFRVARILRSTKLLRKAKRLAFIVQALMSGLRSIGVIFMLLCIVFIIYAAAGQIYLGKNDPWHFQTVHLAFVTLFALLTNNSWSHIFYVNYFGCDVFSGGYYKATDPDPAWRCTQPRAEPSFTMMYFVSFTLVATLVILSMFIGTISLSMGETIQQLNQETKLKKQLKRKAKIAAKMAKMNIKDDDHDCVHQGRVYAAAARRSGAPNGPSANAFLREVGTW